MRFDYHMHSLLAMGVGRIVRQHDLIASLSLTLVRCRKYHIFDKLSKCLIRIVAIVLLLYYTWTITYTGRRLADDGAKHR